jgi:biotin carboxyl carrier protein
MEGGGPYGGPPIVLNMQYEFEVGGRTRQVTVRKTGDHFAVTVDGQTWQVDAARVDAHTLSLLVDTVSRKGYDVIATPDPANTQLTLYVGTTPVTVARNGRRRGRSKSGPSSVGPQRVVAPMPGKVVRVLVKIGDAVHARQPLVVVEAMKMENELKAGRDGIIADVHAREGASVDAGALLVMIQ